MTAIPPTSTFANIFSTQESAAIWSDETRTKYYLAFEAGLARVQADLGIIPKPAADLIIEQCRLENLDFDQLRQHTELIGYPVLPVVKQLVANVNAIAAGHGEWTHYGATTQDVTDTATVLQLRDTLDLVDACLAAITTSLVALCRAHAATPMPARSNLQHAVPITFGFKMARLLASFRRHAQRLAQLRPRLLVLEFSGAAGTLATLPPSLALRCQSALAAHLSLSVPSIAWHTERDVIAETGSLLALLTSTCAKFALDVKLSTQTEVNELAEPFAPHRGSSSTMPQKRNPISCAYITAAATSARHLAAALLDAVVADHERSTGPWQVEWIVLPQLCTLTHAALAHTRDLLAGLVVYPARMRANLDKTNGAVASEAVMMALAPRLGRQRAHDLVYDLCRRAGEEEGEGEKKMLLDLLDECDEIPLSRDELESLCDPAKYLGLSEEMTRRVLDEVEWPVDPEVAAGT